MDALRAAANSPGVQALIDSLTDPPELQGYALGVHGNFVHLYRNQFGISSSINDILEGYGNGNIPQYWPDECMIAGFPPDLSPIYVVIYVRNDPNVFRSQWNPPTIIPGNYAVYIERIDPFIGHHDRTDHHSAAKPLKGGISVSTAHRNIGGTLGGLVADNQTGSVYLLSCNHVIYDNSGAQVLQRARGDGGHNPANYIADISHSIALLPPAGYGFSAPYNKVDAALGQVHPGVQVSSQIRLIPSITQVATLQSLNLGDNVLFVGKESDHITARIYRYIARMKVDIFSNGVQYYFGDIFEIESRVFMYFGSLSKPGDSGSWVITETNSNPDELCGSLFAGNGKTSLCCFAENVFTELNAIPPGASFQIY